MKHPHTIAFEHKLGKKYSHIDFFMTIQLGSIGGSNPNYRYFLPLLLAVHIHIEQAFPTKINELTESQ